jgi:hypothetical protein
MNKVIKKYNIYIILILFGLTSCISPHPHDTSKFYNTIMSFKNNKTTDKDVLLNIGDPEYKKIINGKETWVYWRQQLTVGIPFLTYNKNADSYYKLIFNDQKIVEKISVFNIGYSGKNPKAIKRNAANKEKIKKFIQNSYIDYFDNISKK